MKLTPEFGTKVALWTIAILIVGSLGLQRLFENAYWDGYAEGYDNRKWDECPFHGELSQIQDWYHEWIKNNCH